MKNIIAQFCAWDSTRARPEQPRRNPADLGATYEQVRFPSAHNDRVMLSGWLMPPGNMRSIGAVILCHGHTSTRLNMLGKAMMLRRHHFTTLLFDFRARGTSEGQHCTLGDRETDDVLGAVALLASREDTRDLPIAALGESMGGAAVIRAAARNETIRAVVSEAAYASLEAVLGHRMKYMVGPFAPSVAAACRQVGNREYGVDIRTVSPEAVVAAICPRPLMVIQDALDLVCPRSQSERLWQAAAEPKERWIVPLAPHVGAFHVAPAAYEDRVSAFLHNALSPGSITRT